MRTLKLVAFILLLATACSNEKVATNKDLRAQIELKDRQKQLLEQEVQRAKQNVEKTESDLLTLQAGRDSDKDALSKGLSEKAKAIEAKDLAERALEESKSALKKAEAELLASKQSVDSLGKALEAKKSEYEQLRIELAKSDVSDKLRAVETERDLLKASIGTLATDLKKAGEDLTKAQNDASTSSAQLAAAQAKVNELSPRADSQTKELEKLNAELNKLRSENGMQEITANLAKAEKEVIELRDALALKTTELETTQASLKKEIEHKDATISELNKKNEHNSLDSTSIEKLKSEVKTLTADLTKLMEDKSKVEKELTAAKRAMDDFTLPVQGMYYAEDETIVDGKKCRHFIHVDNDRSLTQAFVCEDNRIQLEKRKLRLAEAVPLKYFPSGISLKYETLKESSSCKADSMFKSNFEYHFERFNNLTPTTGSGQVAVFMNNSFTPMISTMHNLVTEQCEGLVHLAKDLSNFPLTFQLLLRQSAALCEVINGVETAIKPEVGCFENATNFVK